MHLSFGNTLKLIPLSDIGFVLESLLNNLATFLYNDFGLDHVSSFGQWM